MAVSPYRASTGDKRLEAFEHVRLAFRWTLALTAAAVVGIVGVVAHEIPGRSASTTRTPAAASPATAAPAAGSAGPSIGTGAPGNAGSLSPPATAPAPTQQAPAAVSGGTGW